MLNKSNNATIKRIYNSRSSYKTPSSKKIYIQNIRAKHAKHKIFQNHFENKVIITRKNTLILKFLKKFYKIKLLLEKTSRN